MYGYHSTTYTNTESSDGRIRIDLNVEEEPSKPPPVHVGRDAARAKRKQKGVADSSSGATYTFEHLQNLNVSLDGISKAKQIKAKKKNDPDLDPEVKKEALANARQDFICGSKPAPLPGLVASVIVVFHTLTQKIKIPKNPLALFQENAVNWWREKSQSDNGKNKEENPTPKTINQSDQETATRLFHPITVKCTKSANNSPRLTRTRLYLDLTADELYCFCGTHVIKLFPTDN
ncbi:hypothetical protein LXL04_001335 [Taraxacum kok-saghyz]